MNGSLDNTDAVYLLNITGLVFLRRFHQDKNRSWTGKELY